MPDSTHSPDKGPRRIVVLGSTGSIGTQTLDVVRRLGPERARIVGLAARRNVALLAEQTRETGAAYVAVTDEAQGDALELALKAVRGSGSDALADDAPGRFVGCGDGTLVDLATITEADTVVVAVAGAAGLAATLAACRAGKRVCLATKEVLVAAGELVMRTAREFGAEILPIDSEHSAIFQCIQGYAPGDVFRLWITASGGPFRTWTKEQIAEARVEDALNHPTWRMGGKITIDSATLMNKGLEIIEACWLFDLPLDAVEIVVHPQSVVHSFAEMRDGALLAQLGMPDMRLPIQIALLHPEKVDTGLSRLRPDEMTALTFEKPDHDRFPAIRVARAAARLGGTAPAILNAANETAVGAFLAGKIGFGEILRLVEAALRFLPSVPADTLEVIVEADRTARAWTAAAVADGGIPSVGGAK